VVAAVGGWLHPPGLGAVLHGDGFMQFGADVMQADAVLGGVPGREFAVGYVLAVGAAAGLVVERVMKQTRFFPWPAARLTAYSRNAGSRFSPGGRFRTPEKANTCLGLTGTFTA
jgi:hypothetical protein